MFPLFFLLIENDDDRAFMENLYIEYYPLMYGMALRITRREAEAQDVVSESMLALMKKIPLLRSFPCNKLKAYIVTTVRNRAINLFRREKKESPAAGEALEDVADQRSADSSILERAGVHEIKRAIERLPIRERDILMMKFFRELTDAEIGAELNLRPVSVRVTVSRARKHLAVILAEGREKI